ncbi:hypothetical protein BC830DRAFT_348660 [Chytriomyces sp. MP71]|nr:hypothetical protein BC830DRAFT_348660 [Chytriomyces sp. MP71]
MSPDSPMNLSEQVEPFGLRPALTTPPAELIDPLPISSAITTYLPEKIGFHPLTTHTIHKLSNLRLMFIGDSTMVRLVNKIGPILKTEQTIEADRCNDVYPMYKAESLQFANGEWPPIPENSGPHDYGSKNRGCQDCNGCHSRFFNLSAGAGKLYYLGVEYAHDVEMPSFHGLTTQETVARGYVSRADVAPHILFFNAGIHDAKYMEFLEERYDAETAYLAYQNNLDNYVGLLQEATRAHNTTVIWISTSAPSNVSEGSTPQKMRRMIRMRKDAEAVMSKRKVDIVDVWQMSNSRPHEDNVHMLPDYYQDLALAVLGLASYVL